MAFMTIPARDLAAIPMACAWFEATGVTRGLYRRSTSAHRPPKRKLTSPEAKTLMFTSRPRGTAVVGAMGLRSTPRTL